MAKRDTDPGAAEQDDRTSSNPETGERARGGADDVRGVANDDSDEFEEGDEDTEDEDDEEGSF